MPRVITDRPNNGIQLTALRDPAAQRAAGGILALNRLLKGLERL
jgi:hypothetical protein